MERESTEGSVTEQAAQRFQSIIAQASMIGWLWRAAQPF